MSEEQKKPEQAPKSVHQLADEMPSSLPYAVREAIATLAVDTDDLPRVHEAVFVRDILPVLTGEEGNMVDMKWWGGRFDSPFKGFYIVSPENEILFKVPPLLDRNFKLNPAQSTRDTVNEARANFSNRVYNRPAAAKEEYKGALRKRLDLSLGDRPLEHMKMLDKIFIHYGKPSIFEQGVSEEVRKSLGVNETAAVASTSNADTPKVFAEADYDEEGLLD